ncbi:MAG: monovalent cation/H(+) antiporter subunit G [Balneolaceae bacterium]
MEVQNILTILFVVAGIYFMFVGSLGLIRLPDFYSRTHAASKSDTLGILLVIIGLVIYNGFEIASFKLLLIVLFVALANPIGSHALARAAWRSGLEPELGKHSKKVNKHSREGGK